MNKSFCYILCFSFCSCVQTDILSNQITQCIFCELLLQPHHNPHQPRLPDGSYQISQEGENKNASGRWAARHLSNKFIRGGGRWRIYLEVEVSTWNTRISRKDVVICLICAYGVLRNLNKKVLFLYFSICFFSLCLNIWINGGSLDFSPGLPFLRVFLLKLKWNYVIFFRGWNILLIHIW